MISFQITDNKGKRMKVECPSSWDELTLKNLLDIENCDRAPLTIFSLLTGIEFDILRDSKQEDLEYQIYLAIEFVHDSPKWDELKPPSNIVIDGRVIKIPKDISVLTLGQKIMFDQTLVNATNLTQVIPQALAIYLQPLIDGAKYDRDKQEAAQKVILTLPATQMYALVNFFLTSRSNLKKFGLIGLHLLRLKNSPFKNLREQISSISSAISQQ